MWKYKGKRFTTKDIKDNVSFVYLITNKETGKAYVGKKGFYSTTRKKLKNRVNRKVIRKESDWQDYFGSNKQLIEEATNDPSKFNRVILHLCKTKGEASYLEAFEQFKRKVLLSDDYYNEWIILKVHKSHLKGLLND